MKIPAHIINEKKRKEEELRRRRDEIRRIPMLPPDSNEHEKNHSKNEPSKKNPRKIVVIEL